MEEKIYWHALNSVPGLGPRTYKLLLDYFKTPKAVWEADLVDLQSFFGKKNEIIEQLISWKKHFNIEKSYEQLHKLKIKILTFDDEAYPELLKNIYAFPPLLYYKGNITCLSKKCLAIVGARKASPQGCQIAENLAFELAKNGFVVVSGMARGIDSCAHWGALRAKAETIAVLGCGLDIVYPRENKKLMELISTNGVIISEFPPGTPPYAQNFPKRNRIISGLSLGVVVVEAKEKSGSLITADLALQQGREVFAVPGSILSPYSKGTNHLIQQGAKLVQDINDILEEFGLLSKENGKKKKEEKDFDPVQQSILQLFSGEPLTIDEIVSRTKLKPEVVISQLSFLEIKGIIKQLPGQRYITIHLRN